jgi:hypothetical protein
MKLSLLISLLVTVLVTPQPQTSVVDLELSLDPEDSTYQRGLAGIVSGFHPALFDNLQLLRPTP